MNEGKKYLTKNQTKKIGKEELSENQDLLKDL